MLSRDYDHQQDARKSSRNEKKRKNISIITHIFGGGVRERKEKV